MVCGSRWRIRDTSGNRGWWLWGRNRSEMEEKKVSVAQFSKLKEQIFSWKCEVLFERCLRGLKWDSGASPKVSWVPAEETLNDGIIGATCPVVWTFLLLVLCSAQIWCCISGISSMSMRKWFIPLWEFLAVVLSNILVTSLDLWISSKSVK